MTILFTMSFVVLDQLEAAFQVEYRESGTMIFFVVDVFAKALTFAKDGTDT